MEPIRNFQTVSLGSALNKLGVLFGRLKADLAQVRLKGLAHLSGLLVAVVVRDEVLYRPDGTVRPGLVVFAHHAGIPGRSEVAGAVAGGVPAQALVARLPVILLGLSTKSEDLAKVAPLSLQGVRGLHYVALLFVFGLDVGTRVQGSVGIEVLGGMAWVVCGHYVLHEHPAIAGLPLPLVRYRVARLKGLEQLIILDTHKAVTEPVHAVVVVEGIPLLLA